jgi:hypothetical protein
VLVEHYHIPYFRKLLIHFAAARFSFSLLQTVIVVVMIIIIIIEVVIVTTAKKNS